MLHCLNPAAAGEHRRRRRAEHGNGGKPARVRASIIRSHCRRARAVCEGDGGSTRRSLRWCECQCRSAGRRCNADADTPAHRTASVPHTSGARTLRILECSPAGCARVSWAPDRSHGERRALWRQPHRGVWRLWTWLATAQAALRV